MKINVRFLAYFTADIDFAGHYLAVYGYDDDEVFVVDTGQPGGPMVTGRDSFEEGRLWKGSMSSNAMTWTITVPDTHIDWRRVLPAAIAANAHDYLNPPIANFGAKGIRKTATLIKSWPEIYAVADLAQIGNLMEHGGTGGGLFRSTYAGFVREASGHLEDDRVLELAGRFDAAAQLWTEIPGHLEGCVDDGPERLDAASDVLLRVADIEEAAVSELARVVEAP